MKIHKKNTRLNADACWLIAIAIGLILAMMAAAGCSIHGSVGIKMDESLPFTLNMKEGK